MDIPRLGIESELQLPPYASTTATPDPCYICNLHHSAQQCQILNPLSRARVWIHILMHTSRVHDHWATRELQGSFLFTNGYPEFVGKTILSSSNYILTFIYENISCLCHMYYMLNVWVTFHLSVCLALWQSHRVLFPAEYSSIVTSSNFFENISISLKFFKTACQFLQNCFLGFWLLWIYWLISGQPIS